MRKSVGLWPYLVLNTVSIINMMAMVSLLAEMRAERGFDETSLGIIVGAGYLATMAIQLSVGRFADIGWSKIMVVVASLLVAVSSLIMAWADDLWLAVLSRAVLGLGGGMMGPALRRAVVLHDPLKVTRNLSLITLTDLFGFVVAPIIAAALSAAYGLKVPFIVVGLAMLLVLPLGLTLPTETRRRDGYVPPVGLDLLRSGAVVGALILATLQFFIIGGLESVWAVQLEDAGLSRNNIGYGFLVLALPLGIGAFIGGIVGDRDLSSKRRIRMVASPQAAAGAVLGVLAFSTNSLPMLLFTAALGATFGGFTMPMAVSMFSRELPVERQAAGLGLLGACEVAFGAVGAFGSSALYDQFGPSVMWPSLGAAVVIWVGIGFALASRRPSADAGVATSAASSNS